MLDCHLHGLKSARASNSRPMSKGNEVRSKWNVRRGKERLPQHLLRGKRQESVIVLLPFYALAVLTYFFLFNDILLSFLSVTLRPVSCYLLEQTC